jgi:APA family basic amino acid/polyamine antiporter
MLLATGVVMVVYLALNALIVFSAPASALVGQVDVAAIAARRLGGPMWENAITVIVTLALATSVSSLVMSGPRVYARMAADGYLPKLLIPAGTVPRAAILFQSTIAIVLLWTTTFKALLTYIGFTLSLSTAATVVGLIKLRRLEGEKMKVPGWPWAPVLFVMFVLFSASFTILRQPVEAAFGGATLLLGLVGYRLQRLWRSSPAA